MEEGNPMSGASVVDKDACLVTVMRWMLGPVKIPDSVFGLTWFTLYRMLLTDDCRQESSVCMHWKYLPQSDG
jgi:hypothetical protein